MVGGNGRKPKPEFFSSFVKGGGAIAVTDPDEWDDLPRIGAYNSFLVSPEITLPAEGAPLFLRFDSSWRPELFDAGNNWWWAIDNIEVTTSLAGVPVTPLGDDFYGVGPHHPCGGVSMAVHHGAFLHPAIFDGNEIVVSGSNRFDRWARDGNAGGS